MKQFRKTELRELEKGRYVRIKGIVDIYSPSGHKSDGGVWRGGSSWSVKNPLIRIGRCKHKPKKLSWIKNTDIFGEYKKGKKKRIYFRKGKEMVICSDCGYTLKFGEQLK